MLFMSNKVALHTAVNVELRVAYGSSVMRLTGVLTF